MKTNTRSNVTTIANNLVKQGYNRSKAMVKAWVLVKLESVSVRVAGVTFGKRQQAIKNLTKYRMSDIKIQLIRDYKNPHDTDAVAVVATVKDKGSYHMG
jgi:hypothetical protein